MGRKEILTRLKIFYFNLQVYQQKKTISPVKWYLKRGIMNDFRRQLKINLSYLDNTNEEDFKNSLLFYLISEIVELEIKLNYKSMLTFFQGVFKLKVLNELLKIVKLY
ncbi:hypothetical protein [Carnobacterium maltaromaticum]|uniref:hypothetical protein n=1 Tax=Carnobacterium maltaromaticum TaxID=2751 RepID=UPI00295E37FA|nr:hypothetical protein [Carnobacterium maltaromaticum]